LRPALVVLIAVLATAGCTAATKDLGTQPPGSAAASTASPAAAATPSTVVTAAPTPTPAPTVGEASVSITKKIVHASASSGSYVRYEVIIEVKNSGTGWADMTRGTSDYTVYSSDGSVTATGSFTYAYPRYLGPGETGYLLQQSVTDNGKVADFATVDASGQYDSVEAPGPKITTDKIKMKADSYGGTVSVTGTVTNTSTTDVQRVVVGVIMLDAAGNPLTFDYSNLVDNLNAGQTKGFTASGWAPVKVSQVASTLAFASSMDY
jgi:hypothetical protein